MGADNQKTQNNSNLDEMEVYFFLVKVKSKVMLDWYGVLQSQESCHLTVSLTNPHCRGHLKVNSGCCGHHICIPANSKALSKKNVRLKLPTTFTSVSLART